MKTQNNQVAVAEVAEVVLPDNQYNRHHLGQGYELSEYRTLDREEAKAQAAADRAEGYQAVYCILTQGFFGTLRKVAPERAARIAKSAPKPEVPFSIEIPEIKNTKDARAFARLLLDSARAAEFRYDREIKQG